MAKTVGVMFSSVEVPIRSPERARRPPHTSNSMLTPGWELAYTSQGAQDLPFAALEAGLRDEALVIESAVLRRHVLFTFLTRTAFAVGA